MEGIAGIVYPDVFQMNERLNPMLRILKHRGKDVIDTYTYKNIEVGICGSKLATNDKKTIVIAIDGTVYNTAEIKKELKNKGYHVTGSLLVAAYQCWGNEIFTKLTGDFAIMVLDVRKKQILLARDRIGKKPLYWYHDQTHFIFASELKAIMSTGTVPQTPAMDALSSYLYFGYIPQDMSPIEGVSKLLPSYYLVYNFDGSKSIVSYWSYSSFFEKTTTAPKTEIAYHLEELLTKSVKKQYPVDEPAGCFISGGLGSSSIALYLSKFTKEAPLYAFTVGFQGQNDKDVEAAKDVANTLKLPHECHSISAKTFLDDFVKIVWHLDEPNCDPTVIATWNLSKLAVTKVNRVFSGMGSDELLAGHNRYTVAEQRVGLLSRLLQKPLPMFRAFLIPIFNVIYKRMAYEMLKAQRTDPWQFEYLRHNAIFSEKELAAASPKLSGIFDPEVFLHKFHHLHRVKSHVASYLYYDVKTRLTDSFVLQYDRLSAANTLDWRAPFLDREIVEYLATIPEPEFLFEEETASLLKAIIQDALPQSVVDRPKRTRRYFLRSWMEGQEMRSLFEMLLKGTLVNTGLISEDWIIFHIDRLGKYPESPNYLWAVLVLEIWFRLYINRPIESEAPDITVKALLSE